MLADIKLLMPCPTPPIRIKFLLANSFLMDVVVAPDVQEMLEDIVRTLSYYGYINEHRIFCMRSRGNKANAYARIWNLPDIWQKALEVGAFYIIEVLSEHFDKLPEKEKKKVIIHELLHIPKTFSGALRPHLHAGGQINERTVSKIYEMYLEAKKKMAQD